MFILIDINSLLALYISSILVQPLPGPYYYDTDQLPFSLVNFSSIKEQYLWGSYYYNTDQLPFSLANVSSF